jgi:formate hydrogenlyase subunit 3/multisubunit Na+/H+ antiporter MnhD subunit
VLLIGGFFFFRVILLPSAKVLPENQQSKLLEASFRRFRVVIWSALLTILFSGVYNFIAFLRSTGSLSQDSPKEPVEDPSTYILVLGVKLFIVFIIFTFGVLLTFPYPVFAPVQKRPAPWLNLTLILGLIVIFLSALLRRL